MHPLRVHTHTYIYIYIYIYNVFTGMSYPYVTNVVGLHVKQDKLNNINFHMRARSKVCPVNVSIHDMLE